MSGVAPFYLLSRSDEQYRQVKDRFDRKWSRSDGPPPRIENIFHVDEAEFRVSHRGQRWNAYRLRRHGSWSFGFHGTTRYCHVGCELGERNGRLLVCQNDACGIYGIINHSFKVSRSGRGLFGKGIYTTHSSYKADMFSQTRATGCDLKAMLLCKYVPGRVQRLRIGNPFRTRPCRGYDSVGTKVEAVLMKDEGMTNYHEAVVYRDDAIVPVGVITYTK